MSAQVHTLTGQENELPNGLFGRLTAARLEFHEQIAKGKIKKSGKGAHGAPYYEAGDIIPPALSILAKHGLATTPAHTSGPDVRMGVVDIESGETFVFAIPLGEARLGSCHDVQNKGASQSFSRRYLFIGLMEICEHDLVEETEAKPLIRPTDPATEDQWKVINAAIDTNTIPTKTHEWLVGELDKGKEINVKQASTIIKRIKMQEKEAKSDG
jgi:hypothetical protein